MRPSLDWTQQYSEILQRIDRADAYWRQVDEWYEINNLVTSKRAEEKLHEGYKKYGDYFVGDPINQATDEVADLINYLAAARRRERFLIRCLAEAAVWARDNSVSIDDMIPVLSKEAEKRTS